VIFGLHKKTTVYFKFSTLFTDASLGIILKWFLHEYGVKGVDWNSSGQDLTAGSFEHYVKTMSFFFTKCGPP
jgi:hypothetical protein